MRRGTIFTVLFILAAAGIVIASIVLRQPLLEVTVAVDPLAESWVRQTVDALNAIQPVVNATRPVQFKVITVDDLDVWGGQRLWTSDNHPNVWIASSGASVAYAKSNGLPLDLQSASVARSPLVWGGFVSRVNVVTQGGAKPFDWAAVEEAAKAGSWSNIPGGEASWSFIKLGFAQPDRKMGGVAALFSAAATFDQSATLGQNALNGQAFRDWFKPVIDAHPSFYISGDPLDAMTHGPSTLEIALLPESMFLNRLNQLLISESNRFHFNYPAYQYQLDFPLASWQDGKTTADETAAAQKLRDWLMSATQQATLPQFGLRPVSAEPTNGDLLFQAGVSYGIQLTPNYGQAVQTASLTDVQGLLQWVSASR